MRKCEILIVSTYIYLYSINPQSDNLILLEDRTPKGKEIEYMIIYFFLHFVSLTFNWKRNGRTEEKFNFQFSI